MSKNLRAFESDFPSWYDYPQKELGIIPVSVKDIVGGSSAASENYFDNWSPKWVEYNNRYKKVERFVRARNNGKNKVINLGDIHLFKFYCKKLKKFLYYVGSGGHRRTSVAHRDKIEKIYAKVTEVLNSNH